VENAADDGVATDRVRVLLIDTAKVPACDRLDYWQQSADAAYLPVQIRSPAREQFSARMWGYQLGPLGLFRIVATPNTMVRDSRQIAACDPECLHLSVVSRGRISAAQEGRTGVARIGDIISYDTSYPVVFEADQPYESFIVRIPRSLLGRQQAEIAGRTAIAISGVNGLPRAAVAFLRSLADGFRDGTITATDTPNMVDLVLDLVRGVYTLPAPVPERTRLRSRSEVLLNVQSYIESRLGDPALGPEEIARAMFVSTRCLHKLFESEGTTVCRWIRASRLERCRRDLLDPAHDDETILAIASRWGLPGAQHFSRLFRSEYGCAPRDVRREARRAVA
jgi:AraC-like DNA-binding protein